MEKLTFLYSCSFCIDLFLVNWIAMECEAGSALRGSLVFTTSSMTMDDIADARILVEVNAYFFLFVCAF